MLLLAVFVVYEVAFQLTGHRALHVSSTAYAVYLDATAGKDMWVFSRSLPEEGVDKTGPKARLIICPDVALTRLKWADINEGVRRVLSDRVLTDEELNWHRSSYPAGLPWEGDDLT